MTDLYHSSLPYAQDRQRERTARDTMPGITRTPDRLKCVACERMRTAKTGFDTAAGFVCGMCHSPRRVS